MEWNGATYDCYHAFSGSFQKNSIPDGWYYEITSVNPDRFEVIEGRQTVAELFQREGPFKNEAEATKHLQNKIDEYKILKVYAREGKKK